MHIVNENQPVAPFDRTMGIVAYMTLIGWVIALVQNNEKTGAEKSFTAFHLRQMLGLMLLAFCSWILQMLLGAVPVIGWLLYVALSLGLFAVWVVAVIGAMNGEKREVPYIGPVIQGMFGRQFE